MAVFRRIANLFRRSHVDREINAELQSHIDLRIDDNIAAGMSPAQARRDALLRFGNPTATKERVAAADAPLTVECILRDIRYAWRQLRRSPGFALTAIVILALGIGASTAIFSAVNPILFEPLPYPHANRIMMIWSTFRRAPFEVAFGTYRELAARSHSFESLAVISPWQPVVTGFDKPERLNGQSVSADYFRVLGVAPSVGRGFLAADEMFRGPRVVIISDLLWRRRFAGDRGIVGREVKLDDDTYTVIGVTPQGFENTLAPSADAWTPLRFAPADFTDYSSSAWGLRLHMAGRLRPGVTIDQATRELNQIARTPIVEFPRPRWASLRDGLIVNSLQGDMVRSVKPALLAVLGAVVLLLLIACVNVSNLLLARGIQRRGEFAMRATLGAGRARLIRQSLTESLLLAILSGITGMAVAAAGVRLIIALAPPALPQVNAIAVNASVFVFAFGITTLAGLVAGSIPALQTPGRNLQLGSRESSRSVTGHPQITRRIFVVSVVAFALMLLVGAGLLLRSMQRLLAIDPGFNASNLLTMQIQTVGHEFDDLPSAPGVGDALRRRFFAQSLDEARKIPGVVAAGLTSVLPLSDDPSWASMYGSQFENDEPQSGHTVFRYAISPGYCEAMGIPLRRGRLLDERDSADAPQAALISASLARRQFPGQDAIGKRVHVGPTDRPWYTVVGIVGDVKQTSLAINDPDAVYLSTAQTWFADDTLSLVIRTRVDAAMLAPAIRDAIWRVDKDQAIVRVVTMSKLLAVSVAERRFVLVLFEAFSIVALVLAGTGIYGVLSSSVAERTREIGVRSALGASKASILTLVLSQGLLLTALGLAFGLCGAIVASRAIAALLFGVSHLDPITYVGVTALLLCVSAIACLIPARRAASVDPMQALRSE